MENDQPQITPYATYAIVLTALLMLTTISVSVTRWHLGAYSVAAALIIASIKVRTVISYFMHLRSENLFLRIMVAGVFVLFSLVIIITFIDYLLR
jgi:cytochrome c oxidase subunit IV